MAFNLREIGRLPHHEQKETCGLRPAYRQGRKDTAVKVYTINLESTYLLIMGVPQVGVKEELGIKCSEFGDLAHFVALDEYPAEEFTEVYLVRYEKLQSARVAKRRLDESSFFGGVLHVCFAPEFESVNETRDKLIARQKFVSISTKSGFTGPWNVRRSFHHPGASQPTAPSVIPDNPSTSNSEMTYIWAGKTYTIPTPPEPNSASTADQAGPSNQSEEPKVKRATPLFVPRQALNPSKRQADETSTAIRSKLQMLSTPNLAVTFKKRKL